MFIIYEFTFKKKGDVIYVNKYGRDIYCAEDRMFIFRMPYGPCVYSHPSKWSGNNIEFYLLRDWTLVYYHICIYPYLLIV